MYLVLVLLVVAVMLFFVLRKKLQSQKEKYSSAVSPLNGLNNPVDWFLIIKLPTASKVSNGDCSGCQVLSNCAQSEVSRTEEGACYYYADSTSPALSYYSDLGYSCLTSSSNPLYNTLQQLQGNKWCCWNDQGYDGSGDVDCSSPHAHSKGVVCYNDSGGFVMNVSTPHWPNTSDFTQSVGCQPVNNADYAQQFFCFSMDSSNINSWASSVSNASLCLVSQSNDFDLNLTGSGVSIPSVSLTTLAGLSIIMTVKGGGDNGDEYSPWTVVSAGLGGVPLSVASWTSEKIGSNSGWEENPVYPGSGSMTQILDLNTSHGSFKSVYSYSHAKFAVASDNKTLIFGSMNQQKSQQTRGGDFYAIENDYLWNSLSGWIGNTQNIG